MEIREKEEDWTSQLVELCLLCGLSNREVTEAPWAFFFNMKTEDIHEASEPQQALNCNYSIPRKSHKPGGLPLLRHSQVQKSKAIM